MSSNDPDGREFQLYLNKLSQNKQLFPQEVTGLLESARNLGIQIKWGPNIITRSNRNTTHIFDTTYTVNPNVEETQSVSDQTDTEHKEWIDLSLPLLSDSDPSLNFPLFESTPLRTARHNNIFADLNITSIADIQKDFDNRELITPTVISFDTLDSQSLIQAEGLNYQFFNQALIELDLTNIISSFSIPEHLFRTLSDKSRSNSTSQSTSSRSSSGRTEDSDAYINEFKFLNSYFNDEDNFIIPLNFFEEPENWFYDHRQNMSHGNGNENTHNNHNDNNEDNNHHDNNENNENQNQHNMEAKMHIDKFTGNNDRDIDLFFTQYLRACRVNGWNTPELKARYIPCYLSGAALIALENLESTNPTPTFAEIRTHLEDAFKPKIPVDRAEFKLRTRVQLPNESVENYYQDVMRLCRQVSATMEEKDKARHVLHGLSRKLIKNVMLLKNDTPQEVLENARKVEIADSYGEAILNTSDTGFNNGSREVIDKLTEQIANLTKLTLDMKSQQGQPQIQSQQYGATARLDRTFQYSRGNGQYNTRGNGQYNTRGNGQYNNGYRKNYSNYQPNRGGQSFQHYVPRSNGNNSYNPNYQQQRNNNYPQNGNRTVRFEQPPRFNREQQQNQARETRPKSPADINTRTSDGRVRCYGCGRSGHYISSCPNTNNRQPNRQQGRESRDQSPGPGNLRNQ
jgi:hypothetical protein